jgi:hypothetical protein
MSETYYAVKEGKPLSFLDINAIFSAIYTPRTPASVCGSENRGERHYERGEDDFTVSNNDKIGASLKGKISPTLINRLKGYGVELSSLS